MVVEYIQICVVIIIINLDGDVFIINRAILFFLFVVFSYWRQ